MGSRLSQPQGRKTAFLLLPKANPLIQSASLSKVFHAVDRFSEDVDLSLNRKDFGFSDEKDPYSASSIKQEQKLLEELTSVCTQAIKDSLLPVLENELILKKQRSFSVVIFGLIPAMHHATFVTALQLKMLNKRGQHCLNGCSTGHN